MNMFITAQGFAKTGMLSVLIGAICNIVLDPVFFWKHMGRTRSSACNGYFPGLFHHLGAGVPGRKKDSFENPSAQYGPDSIGYPAVCSAGRGNLCHAVQ